MMLSAKYPQARRYVYWISKTYKKKNLLVLRLEYYDAIFNTKTAGDPGDVRSQGTTSHDIDYVVRVCVRFSF